MMAGPIRLNADFETALKSRALVGYRQGSPETKRMGKLITKVIGRARSVSDAGGLTGATVEELSSQIYGSFAVWLFLWRWRTVIFYLIDIVARIAYSQRESEQRFEAECKRRSSN